MERLLLLTIVMMSSACAMEHSEIKSNSAHDIASEHFELLLGLSNQIDAKSIKRKPESDSKINANTAQKRRSAVRFIAHEFKCSVCDYKTKKRDKLMNHKLIKCTECHQDLLCPTLTHETIHWQYEHVQLIPKKISRLSI